jgi:amino acid transporter
MNPPPPAQPVRAQLSLWDAVSIMVGIIIGATIYETPPLIFSNVGSPWMGVAIWVIAGALCLFGALCYAELASTYPRLGGDYVYLTRAYGSPVGFLYGWAQLAVIQTGSIGMMAYVFADYAAKLWPQWEGSRVLFALAPVAVLSFLNIMGVVIGKNIQNVLTACKVLGLGGILAAGFGWGHAGQALQSPAVSESPNLAFALVLVFLAYGGWNDAAFVTAELRNPRRNIPLALILGTAFVTLIYVLVNAAYLVALGFEGARRSRGIAADVLALPLKQLGFRAMCVLVMISALGAINGLTFTSSRIYAALGSDHSIFARLSRWHPRLGSPVWSLLTQAIIALSMIAVVGSTIGQEALNEMFQVFGVGSVSWEGHGGFETLLKCTAPVFWVFFLLSALSLFVLRAKDRETERPFSVPLFPLIPGIFAATCVFMLYSAINYAGNFGLVGAALLLVGLLLYLLSKRRPAPGEVA